MVSLHWRYISIIAVIAGSSPVVDALANDRDLKATTIPASSCVDYARDNNSVNVPSPGYWGGSAVTWFGQRPDLPMPETLFLSRPLPVNAIDLGGNTNDNDMSSFQIVYLDNDGFGGGVRVEATLVRTELPTAGALQTTPVCYWDSNVNGSGATGWTRASAPCVHDLSGTAFYHFNVYLFAARSALANFSAGFAGIRFP